MAQVLRDFPSAEQMAWRKQEQQWSLEVTIGAVTPENIHPEIDIGPPVGLEAEVLAGLEGMRREADRPLLGGVPYRLTEQAPLWEPEPPEFPMEMPHDDRDASEIPHTPEPDPWWLDA